MNIYDDRNIQVSANGQLDINAAEGVHIGDANTKEVVIIPAGVLFLKFHAADPQCWDGNAPTYVWDALNRLAAALTANGNRP
jgi:hypothetical protein